MKSYALTVSPSTPLVRSSTSLLPARHANPRSGLAFTSSSSSLFSAPALRSIDSAFLISINSKVLSLSSASSQFWRSSLPPLVWSQRASSFKAKATSVPENENADESANPRDLARIMQLAIMFIVWYLLNIYFNIFNKQVLKVYPFPATVTAFQFGCGTVLILLMWGLKLHPRPKLTKSHLSVILTLGSIHTLGNLLTNISLGKVSVSFTHTIKAMEPFFTVLFAGLFLGESPSIWVLASLVPIVGGVALASLTEASFNWIGFGSAMASNVTNQSRNVLSKKFMIKKEESLDNINLFSLITIFSFLFLLPLAIIIEGVKFSPSYFQDAASSGGVNIRELGIRLVLSGICFHSYQQVSYVILGMVSAVTHAVGNSVKRVVVIIASIIFFQTPVLPINSLGTAIALVGVFLYSKAKRMKTKSH